MRHLEATTGRIGGLGAVTTSVVYSSPLKSRPVTTAALGAADPGAGNAI
jgi:Lrp/AsnC family leucine-responsive transcriptional regulator